MAEVDANARLSRITVVTSGTEMIIEQIKNQLGRLVPVHKVSDLTAEGPQCLRIADIFRARVVDSTTESFVFEVTGASEKLSAFISLMEPLGLIEVSRTGVVAIARGATSIMKRGANT